MTNILFFLINSLFFIYLIEKKSKKLIIIQLVLSTFFLLYLNSYHQKFMVDFWYELGIDANQGPEEDLNFYKLLSKLNIRSKDNND